MCRMIRHFDYMTSLVLGVIIGGNMICFLTSSTTMSEFNSLNPENHFIDELLRYCPTYCRVLFICSDPSNHEITDYYATAVQESFKEAGFDFSQFNVLDGRNQHLACNLIHDSNLIILAGGHVPTQNRFFQQVELRNNLKAFEGVIIGISAGSMNSADTVYAQPELEGEAIDPNYQRFLVGLGLTKTMLLPHYETVKNDVLDGQRVIEDITFQDSHDRTFYAIPDGSYLFIKSGKEELRGEAYRIQDGRITQISKHGDIVLI